MGTTALGDVPGNTSGDLPAEGDKAPAFTLVADDLSEFTLDDLPGRRVLNIFPSIGTGVCQAGVRKFNELAGEMENTTVVNVSVDLPFAQAGFCAAEGLDNVKVGSAFRSSFGEDYGVRMVDTKFKGLLGRAVVVVDEDGTVRHSQLVPNIAQEPDYDAVLASLG